MTGWTDEARKAALEARRRKSMGKTPKYTKAQKATLGFRFHGIPSVPKINRLTRNYTARLSTAALFKPHSIKNR